MRLIPGDPALVILSEGDASFTQGELEALRHELGTDRPIVVQYLDWVTGLAQGDLGESYWRRGLPVWGLLGDRIPRTLQLAVMAIVIAVIFAVPLGVISAIKPDSPIDYVCRVVALVGISIPTFFAGILVVLVLSRGFDWLPPLGYAELWEDPWTNIRQMFLPALALGFYDMAFIARVTRSSMMEILREDYMRTARAKGLRETAVLVRHGLKNAVLPILTISGWQFGRLFGGTVIIEKIFLIPGVGQLLIDAIYQRDFPTIQAVIVIVALSIVVVNLLVDLLYGWLDPRIRYA